MFEGTAEPSSEFVWIRTAHTGASLSGETKTDATQALKVADARQEQQWEAFTETHRRWGKQLKNSIQGKRTYNSRRCGQHHRTVLCKLPADQQWRGGNGETVQQQA